ncbi:MAG: hypothetical protein O7E57_09775, partial [Gammaproteobacteria bacterium]|nr:hypothetical protein [Gammaproteobacteria bacterium]
MSPVPYWEMDQTGDWEAGIFVETGGQTESHDLGMRLADVNGDGLPDLVVGYCSISRAPCEATLEGPVVYINDGSGWVEDDNWTNAIQDLTYQAPTITVHSALYTGADGSQYDRACYATNSTVTRRISFGTSEAEAVPTTDGNRETFTPWPSWHLIDINGDGFADLVTSIRGGVLPRQHDCDGVSVPFIGPDESGFPRPYQLLGGRVSKKIFLNNGTGWDPAPAGMAESLPLFQAQTILKHRNDKYSFILRPILDASCDASGWLGGEGEGYGSYCTTFMDFRPQFVELNGDGLVDIIILEPRFSDLWLEHFAPWDAWIGDPNSSAWIQNADGSGWTRAPDFDLPFPHIKSLQIKAKAFSIFGVGGMLSFDAGVYFVDLNRDGLTDIAHDDWIANEGIRGDLAHGSAGVLLNTGTGWCNDQGIVGHDHNLGTPLVVPDCDGPNEANATSRYVPPIAFNRYTDFGGLEDTATSRPEQLVFVDVNGDGWVDLLQGKNEPRGTDNVRKAWLHDPSASSSVWVERSVDFKPPTPFYPGTQFVDLDGNGTIDILHGWLLYINTSAAFVADAYLSPGTNSDLLASVENGRGGLTEFTYTNAVAQRFQTLEDDAEARAGALGDADGSSETVTRFDSKSVVAETKVSGVGIADNVVTKYRYGRPRFDPIERSGLGFGLIETTNPDSSRVDAYYYQREGLVGRPALQETFDKTGSQLHTSGQTWVLAANLGSISGAMDGVHVARSSNQFSFNVYAVENGPLNSTENGALNISSFSYDDAHGYNFVSQITTTRATGTLSTRFEPKDAHQPDWLVGMVAEKKQIANGITYSREEYDYTLKGQIKERRRDIGLRDTNAASDVATTSWIYDDKGNVTSQTETRGKDAAGNLLANPTRTVSFCYDGDGGGGSWCPKLPKGTPATHSLRVGITDAIGGVTKLEYDWSTGAVLHVERFNEGGAFRDSITVMRDAFRRNIELWFRGASFAQGDLDVQLATTVYHDAPIGNTPAFVEKFQITGEVGGAPIRTATYLDGFGNRLRSVEETPSGYRGIAVFRDPVTRIVRTTGPIVCTDLGA